MPTGHTLVLIKPDAVLNGWDNSIIDFYKEADLEVIYSDGAGFRFTQEQVAIFYQEHSGKPFFAGLCLAMSSGPCRVVILKGDDPIERVRALNGATDPAKAAPGTIRAVYRSAGGPFNTVHASDSPEAFLREYALLREIRAIPIDLI